MRLFVGERQIREPVRIEIVGDDQTAFWGGELDGRLFLENGRGKPAVNSCLGGVNRGHLRRLPLVLLISGLSLPHDSQLALDPDTLFEPRIVNVEHEGDNRFRRFGVLESSVMPFRLDEPVAGALQLRQPGFPLLGSPVRGSVGRSVIDSMPWSCFRGSPRLPILSESNWNLPNTEHLSLADRKLSHRPTNASSWRCAANSSFHTVESRWTRRARSPSDTSVSRSDFFCSCSATSVSVSGSAVAGRFPNRHDRASRNQTSQCHAQCDFLQFAHCCLGRSNEGLVRDLSEFPGSDSRPL